MGYKTQILSSFVPLLETRMNQAYRFTDFSDLYRAAFAESNPTTKQLLLAEVKKALDRWAESMADGMPASERLACTDVDSSRLVSFRHAA